MIIEQDFPHIGKQSVNTDTLPEESLRYLLTYGLKQSVNDARAAAKADAVLAGALMRKRLDAILAGTVNVRTSGPRDDEQARMERQVAYDMIVAAAKRQGKAVPTGEALTKLRNEVLAKRGEAIAAEATKRLTATKELDLDDLL